MHSTRCSTMTEGQRWVYHLSTIHILVLNPRILIRYQTSATIVVSACETGITHSDTQASTYQHIGREFVVDNN